MVSPYSNYLSDYYSTSKEKFVVTLLNRDLLKPNLEAVGNVRPNNSAAHHIVVGGSSKADDARKLLKEADIDINEASNGVFLPKSSKYVIDEASPHANVHTDAYYRNIYDRLEKTPINQRRYELQKIAEELQNGIFPY
ncbi:MAG: AHH domain-containing protein [Bacteroidales bacterium]|jgi:hypothetical protein|nr:AHH domain-containing protein [Bacteroidales bacterium]